MREQAWQRFRSSGRRSGRRRTLPAAVAVAVGVMTMGALAPPAASAAARPHTVQRGMDALVHTNGVPAVRRASRTVRPRPELHRRGR